MAIAAEKALRVACWLADRGFGDPKVGGDVAVRDDGTIELDQASFDRYVAAWPPLPSAVRAGGVFCFGVPVEVGS